LETVYAPKNFTPESAAGFLQAIWRHINAPSVRISFERTEFVEPYSALLTATSIRSFVKKRLQDGRYEMYLVPPQQSGSVANYLAKIGFFQFIRIDRGAQPDRFVTSDGCFTSILYLTRDDLESANEAMQARLDAVAHDLANQLLPATNVNSDLLAEAFAYCLREAIRNSFEHGRAKFVFFLAQAYKDNTVEFALLDEGIGIASSLGKVFIGREARDLLELSLKPGITEYIGPETEDKWQNSGFGLYVLSELAKHYGAFSIASNDWQISYYGKSKKINPVTIPGTALRLRLKIDEPEYFANVREGIVLKGEAEASALTGARKSASKASRGALF
jgi:hypothetical protein